MAKFSAIALSDVEPLDAYALERAVTGVGWSKRLSPTDYSLFLVVSELHDGARIAWDAPHGDEAVCVLEGEMVIDDRRCPAGGAIIVEADVICEARAVGTVRVAHFGPTDPVAPVGGMLGPACADNHGVHVLGEHGWFRNGTHKTWWADSTCATCRITIFRIDLPDEPIEDIPHSHTEDEIIFMLEGELRMGSYRAPKGTALSIPANMRYLLRSDGNAFRFINYRRDASKVVMPGCGVVDELALASGGVLTGDFR